MARRGTTATKTGQLKSANLLDFQGFSRILLHRVSTGIALLTRMSTKVLHAARNLAYASANLPDGGNHMLDVIAVCSGNTCRSPLFAAALRLISDDVSVRSACAPYREKEDDSRPVPGMSDAFGDAANQLIDFGVVERARRRVIPKLVKSLFHHHKTEFAKLDPQPSGREMFVVAAKKHRSNMKRWVRVAGYPNAYIDVIDISDSAWKVFKSQKNRIEKEKRKRNAEERKELRDSYHALAILTILRACEILPALQRRMGRPSRPIKHNRQKAK
jgi:hypothetical protein